jgi:hypothetical protein
MMHADRTNRLALTIFGLVVLAAGVFALAASVGALGGTYAHGDLLANRAAHWVGAHGSWFWWAVAGACLIILLLALRWIITLLLSTDRAGDITITRSGRQGGTTMRPAAITGAITREIDTYRGTSAAKARVLGEPGRPELAVTVTAAATADLAALRHRIETHALAHARQALGRDNLPIQLDINVDSHTPQRVT